MFKAAHVKRNVAYFDFLALIAMYRDYTCFTTYYRAY